MLRGLFFDHQQNHTQTFHVYTDGSRTAEGVAYGYFCAERSFHCRISSLSSVYTAELLAIRDAITYLLESYPAIGAVMIFSDFRSAFQAVSSRAFHPKILHSVEYLVTWALMVTAGQMTLLLEAFPPSLSLLYPCLEVTLNSI